MTSVKQDIVVLTFEFWSSDGVKHFFLWIQTHRSIDTFVASFNTSCVSFSVNMFINRFVIGRKHHLFHLILKIESNN